MQSKMSELTCSYLDSLERAIRVREEIVQTLRDADRAHRRDPRARELVLREMQRDFYCLVLADKLREMKKYANVPRLELIGEAGRILDKGANYDGLTRPPRGMRTLTEEKMYGALRVRWFELMKLAAIKPLSRGSRS